MLNIYFNIIMVILCVKGLDFCPATSVDSMFCRDLFSGLKRGPVHCNL